MMKTYLIVIIIAINFISCEESPKETLIQFNNPGSTLGSEPNLHLASDGTIYLSWIEANKGKNSKLFISALNEKGLNWNTPNLIAEGSNWFVNWADFPSITSFGTQNLAAHYLDKSADDTYAYDVKLTISNDKGKTWNNAIIPHRDKTNTEHGFVSKVDLSDDKLLSIWLDGRKYAYHENDSTIAKEMTLRGAILNKDSNLIEEFELDDRVCDCCQTDAAITKKGPIVVYRDRSKKEIRDIAYTRMINGEWTQPQSIHNDNWSIFGCPVNGPAVSTKNSSLAVAWFTNADDEPKVKVIFSNNNGDSFGDPIIVDQVNPSGRVDVEMLDNKSALVSWLDNIDGQAIIQLQRVYIEGNKSQVLTASESSESRSSGFPRMVVKSDEAYLAWTNSGDTLTVKTAKINLNQLIAK